MLHCELCSGSAVEEEAAPAAAAGAARGAGREGAAAANGAAPGGVAISGLLAGLDPTVLLSSAPRQPGAAVEQPAEVAAAATNGAAAAQLWHGWSPFEVCNSCTAPMQYPPA